MYELYFIERLLQELALADQTKDPVERSIHLQACRYYRELLAQPAQDSHHSEALTGIAGDDRRG